MSEHGSESENPVIEAPEPKPTRPHTNRDWWPNQPDLQVLAQHSPRVNPMGADFDYASEFARLDVDALKQDLMTLMTSSQPWWPADYGHYGPLFIRMSWHAAGTYRIADGRGGGGSGAQRFAPLNSWPDNVSLDKARRLLWPIKQKYGRAISWADLLVFAGNCAYESMGLPTFGFGFGREDIWEPEEIFWGPEDTWLGDERYAGDRELVRSARRRANGPDLRQPRGSQREPGPAGLGPGHPGDLRPDGDERRGNGRPHRRRSHRRQGARGRRPPPHRPGARGRADGAAGLRLAQSRRHRGGCRRADQWSGGGVDPGADGSGTTASWTTCSASSGSRPRAPAGATQWTPTDAAARDRCPTPTSRDRRHAPMMLTSDLALKVDPIYAAHRQALPREPRPAHRGLRQGVVQAVAPRHGSGQPLPRPVGAGAAAVAGSRSLPSTTTWSPTPTSQPSRSSSSDRVCRSRQLVSTAWAAAASFRGTDKRGGANGARIRLAPQKDWEVNDPGELAGVLAKLEQIQADFNAAQTGRTRISLADLIVLGGSAAVEQAAQNAGHEITVPFAPGRTDATVEQTDVEHVRRARTRRRRLPQLPPPRREAVAGNLAGRPGVHAHAQRRPK